MFWFVEISDIPFFLFLLFFCLCSKHSYIKFSVFCGTSISPIVKYFHENFSICFSSHLSIRILTFLWCRPENCFHYAPLIVHFLKESLTSVSSVLQIFASMYICLELLLHFPASLFLSKKEFNSWIKVTQEEESYQLIQIRVFKCLIVDCKYCICDFIIILVNSSWWSIFFCVIG